MMDYFCSCCGEYTHRRGAFGELLCAECHEAQDAAVEAHEQAQAERLGYDQQ